MAICKNCGTFITFGKTKNDKLIPLNIDGKPHWKTCTNFNRNKKPVKREINFDTDFKCERMEQFECQHMVKQETKNGLKCLDCGQVYNEDTLEWE